MDIPLIDFLEFEEVMKQLKEEAAIQHPDKKLVPFWRLSLRNGNELVIRASVSDGTVGPKESVELTKPIDEAKESHESK